MDYLHESKFKDICIKAPNAREKAYIADFTTWLLGSDEIDAKELWEMVNEYAESKQKGIEK
jgi:hypothetical protein